MAQFGLPTSDVSISAFIECVGAAGDIFDSIDEGIAGADDASTYIASGLTIPDQADFGLNSITDPASSTGHVIRARIREGLFNSCNTSTAGAQTDHIITLLQTTTTIATNTLADITSTWATHTYTLSGAEADSITDYTALRLRTGYAKVGGGSSRGLHTSALEFECPDAAGGGGRTTKNTRGFPLGMEIGMGWRMPI